ncbi:MAG: alpha-D-ribose 1-methylphosphonate 5-triphosphate diphosphatase [Alphaproteobacteria bacterium]
MRRRLVGGRVLVPGAGLEETSVEIEDGRIAGLGGSGHGMAETDVGGAFLLPGIVDFHGDAFERQLMPRPGVRVPVDIALADTDAQLAAAGITTAFHGVTCSWEPGLRSVETMRDLMEGLDRLASVMLVAHRIHLRFEADNLDVVDELAEGLADGRIHLLALNDHTPAIAARLDRPEALAKYVDRACVPADVFRARCLAAMARRDGIDAAAARLTGAARAAGVAIAAHDETSADQRRRNRGLGAAICEFPMDRGAAVDAADAGEPVVMGAPNVMRGGSHLGNDGAADYVARGLCRILASDYHYPSLFHAPFRLAADGHAALADAWRLVSAAPAAAVGLDDRGELRPGARADLLLVERNGAAPRLARTLVRGRSVWGACDV